jgi:predicted MPP superfamily phosphohydrolase
VASLLITHSPQVIRTAMSFQPALVLSGHTHGGQVRVPGMGPIRTQNPLSRMIAMGRYSPDELARLLQMTTAGSTWLYVSRGLGLAFIPNMRWLAPRFLCRPEVTLITISR